MNNNSIQKTLSIIKPDAVERELETIRQPTIRKPLFGCLFIIAESSFYKYV